MTDDEPATAHVTSADGTRIGYEVVGAGPPLLVIHGGAADRTQWYAIKDPLASRFTTYLMDRRGRGLSAEEAERPYALEREAEDVAAVVDAIGDPPYVFSHSIGGLCALKAAADGVRFRKLVIDEAPTGRPGPSPLPDEVTDRMARSVDAGDPDGALEVFLRAIGLNDEQIEGVRGTEMWVSRVATIHTIVRETRANGAYRREAERLAALAFPVRFIVGTGSTDALRQAAEAAHGDMPRSELVTVDGRLFTSMYADPDATAGAIVDWFLSD